MLRFLNFPTQLTNLRRFNNHAKDNDPWIANDISNKKQKKKKKKISTTSSYDTFLEHFFLFGARISPVIFSFVCSAHYASCL
jgi:hypothetical protein